MIPIQVQEQSDRVKVMNELYDLDNRSDPKHEHTSTFTGLWAKREELWAKRDGK
tara:strand:- start:4872 stop:5033 length:162 start_codon:yes stop_codon:yes gene_type:complete